MGKKKAAKAAKKKVIVKKKAAVVARKAPVKKAAKAARVVKVSKIVKRLKASAAEAPVAIKAPPVASLGDAIDEARTQRLHIIYFRKRLGAPTTADSPEWLRIGAKRVEDAIAAFDKFPDLEGNDTSCYGTALDDTKARAAQFSGLLARLASNLLNRIVKAGDRKQNEAWYEKADAALDEVALNLEAFGEAQAAPEPAAPTPTVTTGSDTNVIDTPPAAAAEPDAESEPEDDDDEDESEDDGEHEEADAAEPAEVGGEGGQ